MSLLDLEELHSSRRPSQLVRIPPEMDVPVTRRVMRVVDTPAFRRLHDISQLGLVNRVYPGARHTRFEHSLGVYRLALLALEQLAGDAQFARSVDEKEARLLVLAALLHDVGHWPYCHPIEDMRLPYVQRHEAHARELICSGELADCIREDWQTDPAAVADLIAPREDLKSSDSTLSQGLALVHGILSGPIDIDKLDYLQRDSLHAGVPYGRNFDQRRLLASLCVGPSGREVAITAKGKTAAEMMVFSRYVMFSEVYWHHAVRSATAMLQRLIYGLAEAHSADQWLEWGDSQMNAHLMAAAQRDSRLEPLAAGLFGRQRGLYKRLLEFNYVENPQAHRTLARRSYADLVACTERLAERLSRYTAQPLAATELLIDAPPVKLEVQFHLSVRLADGEFQTLSSLSPVVRALATEQFDDYVKRVHVFIAPGRRAELQLSREQLAEELLAAAS
ncbi:MAG: HD domain-containing protein [Aureliella sp.]